MRALATTDRAPPPQPTTPLAHAHTIGAPRASASQGETGLIAASLNGRLGLCDALIAAGANINLQDKSGNTAVMVLVHLVFVKLTTIARLRDCAKQGCSIAARTPEEVSSYVAGAHGGWTVHVKG